MISRGNEMISAGASIPPKGHGARFPPTLSPPSISEAHRPSVLFLLSCTDDRGGGGVVAEISEAHRPSVLFLLSCTDDRGGGGSRRDF